MKRKIRNISSQFKNLATHEIHQRWVHYPILILAVIVLIGTAIIIILSRNLPSLTTLESYNPMLVTKIYSVDGKVLKELYMQNRIQVPLERMPTSLLQATIATEDRRFYQHWGLDLRRIVKAAMIDLMTMSKRQGAGTISGQLARILYLTPEKAWKRKIREALTAIQIERTYSKPEILEMYLNHMFFENHAYGVQAAAKRYFKKNVEDLRVEESALLVGILQRPAKYAPYRNPDEALARRNLVLRNMASCGYLAQSECDSLQKLKMVLNKEESEDNTIAPYFCEYIRQLMEKKYGLGIHTDGLSIYTTLDTRIQACADSAVKAKLPELEKMIQRRIVHTRQFVQWLPDSLKSYEEFKNFMSDTTQVDSILEAKTTLQVALVALDPSNGHILAMIGGRDFEKSKFNRAVQAKRQPGSAFKPFCYTAAIDNGYPTTYELLNQPVVLQMVDGTEWRPQNYDETTGGLTTLRQALKKSLNLVTIRLVQEVVPPDKVVACAKRFGLTTTILPYDAIALGVFEVIPLELVSAFSVFANQGVRADPVAILRVEDKDGNLLEEAIPQDREVISEETAYIMTDMLRTAIDHGTGYTTRVVYGFTRPAGGKTGTTNDFTDAWFLGFTPQITAGVWIGFDDKRISLGKGQSGAVVAIPIWAPFMKMVYDSLKLPEVDFRIPPGVVRLKVCSESKLIATEFCPVIWDEVFTHETAPTESCPLHQSPTQKNIQKNKGKHSIF